MLTLIIAIKFITLQHNCCVIKILRLSLTSKFYKKEKRRYLKGSALLFCSYAAIY
uniref:Uncharacterized protein n=1 Tax=Myoviridae sp. ctQf419 TaxID=2825102 RepID=A0A8S5UKW5_9CAUD|nr:MAG TPA: hypothetical protein [Myoviridae sp. ctQf419]